MLQNRFYTTISSMAFLLLIACTDEQAQQNTTAKPMEKKTAVTISATPKATENRRQYSEEREACSDFTVERRPLYGELHVHTALSFDAAAARTRTLPADAYRFAKGEAINFFPLDDEGNPAGKISIDRPLDFAAVTDHAEFLGETALCREPDSPAYDGVFCTEYRKVEFRGAAMIATAFSGASPPHRIDMLCGEDGQLCRDYAAGPWQILLDAAEQAYDRSAECTFTSFVGYEHSGSPNNSNYHRNVIFRNANVPALPVSYMESPYDYLLWQQLDAVCNDDSACEYLTIPHNSNLSNGRLLTPYANLEPTLENRRDYAQARLRNEPIMEIFQHKGGSECINNMRNIIGAPDELCDFEQVRNLGSKAKRINISLDGPKLVFDLEDKAAVTQECENGFGRHGMMGGGCVSDNDFLRSALLTGMAEEQDIGFNPVKFGVIGSSDAHTATPGSVKEDSWGGYVTGEMTLENRLKPGNLPSGILGNPGGLAGVWSEENSRDAIFNAMQRREVFGTSGPRIAPRFFAGWEFPANSCELPDMITQAYANGVPMGSDLAALPDTNSKPMFIASALRDPDVTAAPLQQLQIIKGWVSAEGEKHYKVMDVAGNADNGATVDPATGERKGEGYASLCTVFRDDDFDASVPSYYYMRVVENPSPRWSLLDCMKFDAADKPAVCADSSRHIIQEMAWTSPIWYSPK